MNRLHKTLAHLALACAAWPACALAASTASVSISDSIGASVGSASVSVQKSSDSSSRRERVAEGDYRIVEVAAVAAQPGFVRLRLRAEAEAGADAEFFLLLPQAVVEQNSLAVGHIVSAHQRPYGVELAKAQNRQAFFLVLDDDWHRELAPRPVVL